MVLITNILVLPLVVAATSLDAFLLLASARLLMAHIRAPWAAAAVRAVAPLTDWAPNGVQRLARRHRRHLGELAAWIIAIVFALLAKSLLVGIIQQFAR